MARFSPLSAQEINQAIVELDGWSVVDGKLHAEFRFADFVEAFAFMTKVAIRAEGMDHHPEWFNVYSRVVIDLVTHDADNQISAQDIELAYAINALI